MPQDPDSEPTQTEPANNVVIFEAVLDFEALMASLAAYDRGFGERQYV
jgi:hypothetical protein